MMPTGEAPAVLPTGPEPEDVDVKQFYVPSDALDACDAPGAEAAALAERLDSDSWTLACASLLIVRRLATHHPDHLAEVLDVVLPKVRHHMNSLRSSLCKTALICAADLFRAFGDIMLEHLETGEPSMLTTLLSKAALEKRFVMDEAKRTLAAAVSYLSVEDIMRALLDRVGSKMTRCARLWRHAWRTSQIKRCRSVRRTMTSRAAWILSVMSCYALLRVS